MNKIESPEESRKLLDKIVFDLTRSIVKTDELTRFWFFILIMFLANGALLISVPIYYFYHHSITIPLICLAAKFIIEFLITLKSAQIYQRFDLIKYFPVWVILQMPYVLFSGILGTFGHFKWKDRHHFQELTIFRTEQ